MLQQFNGPSTSHSSRRLIATETELQEPFIVERFFSFIKNDGPGKVIIGIDEDTTNGTNLIYLDPGEQVPDLPRVCSTIYYRSELGQATIRVLGV